MASLLFNLLFPPPASLFITVMSVMGVTSSVYIGLSEVMGRHLQYSKFWNADPTKGRKQIQLSSRAGMLLLYTPALAAGLASFGIPGLVNGTRSQLLSAALSLHFFKRVIEVIFVHRYSGHMILDSAILTSFGYFIGTVCMIYAQYLTQNMPEPAVDLKLPGVILFLVGLSGNFYHHYLLSKLRGKDDKGYKIPRGGLFGLVICPHYLFEITGFVGVSLISQTLYTLSVPFGILFYLMGRSYATRKWYISKFENFPRNVKALIPYVF